jgi:hypothetical protein
MTSPGVKKYLRVLTLFKNLKGTDFAHRSVGGSSAPCGLRFFMRGVEEEGGKREDSCCVHKIAALFS